MFWNKNNRKRFKLNINKKQAEKEYEEYLNQPPEVLENLKKCKIFMAIYIPLGVLLSVAFEFKSIVGSLVSFGICLSLGIAIFFSLKKEYSDNWKLRLVPLICLSVGQVIGLFCIQKIILIILNVTG
ncbi:hypothetical protein [uncultured Treponema sp.]|uniref:hypothetical protein n=1 Tax=uncultured Treponema sp. TaxID=162155 RepID=UPI00259A82F3|nr:hypothetical protein [uncultured Treponema sp.]